MLGKNHNSPSCSLFISICFPEVIENDLPTIIGNHAIMQGEVQGLFAYGISRGRQHEVPTGEVDSDWETDSGESKPSLICY